MLQTQSAAPTDEPGPNVPADEVDDDDDDVIGGDVISVVDDVVDGASAGEGEGGSGCVEVAAGAGLALAGGSLTASTLALEYSITSLVLTPHCRTRLLAARVAVKVSLTKHPVVSRLVKPGMTPLISPATISSIPPLETRSIRRGWESGLHSMATVQLTWTSWPTGILQSLERHSGGLSGPQATHCMVVVIWTWKPWAPES
jgi:hypothetical protein